MRIGPGGVIAGNDIVAQFIYPGAGIEKVIEWLNFVFQSFSRAYNIPDAMFQASAGG